MWVLVVEKLRELVFGVAATEVSALQESFRKIHHPTGSFLAGTDLTDDKPDLYRRKSNPRKVTVGSLAGTIRALVNWGTARASPSEYGYEESLHKMASFSETEMLHQKPQDFRCSEF